MSGAGDGDHPFPGGGVELLAFAGQAAGDDCLDGPSVDVGEYRAGPLGGVKEATEGSHHVVLGTAGGGFDIEAATDLMIFLTWA